MTGFQPHVSLGLGSKPQTRVLILSGIQCQLLWVVRGGGGGLSVPPKGMPGNACTQPGWPTRYCLALGVLEALGFGYSSEIELEVSLLPAGQFARVSNIQCLRVQGDEVGPREMFFLPSEKEGYLKMPGNLSCPEL